MRIALKERIDLSPFSLHEHGLIRSLAYLIWPLRDQLGHSVDTRWRALSRPQPAWRNSLATEYVGRGAVCRAVQIFFAAP